MCQECFRKPGIGKQYLEQKSFLTDEFKVIDVLHIFVPIKIEKNYSGTNHNVTIKIDHYIDIYEILRFSSEMKTGISPSEIKKFISLCYVKIKNIIESDNEIKVLL